MAVSIRTFVNCVPKAILKKYFEKHPVQFQEPIDWLLEPKPLAQALEKALKALPKSAFDPVHLNFERIHILSNENGIRAFLNASKEQSALEKHFSAMDNDYHRAAVVFLDDPDGLFKTAEELLFVDYKTQGRSWFHGTLGTKKDLTDISQEDANAFAFEVANIFFRNYDKPDDCCGEKYRRFVDGTIQISVYINDLSNSDLMVKKRALHRVDTKNRRCKHNPFSTK